MDRTRFKELAQTFSAIPVYRELLDDVLTPVSLFLKIREGASYPFLLESVEGGEQLARYSFLGRDPYQVFTFQGGMMMLQKDGETQRLNGDFYDRLNELVSRYREPKLSELPRLTGGAVGYVAYDTIRQTEHLPDIPEDDLKLPDAVWAFYNAIYAFDHVRHRIILIRTVLIDNDEADLDELYDTALAGLDDMQEQLRREIGERAGVDLQVDDLASNTSRERYMDIVEQGRRYIYEGDIFQVVLSQRFSTQYTGDRFALYRALRTINPSPYLFYLDFGDFALIGSSPEVQVRVQEGRAEVLPIAGTRPRGKTTEEDAKLAEELANDAKEVSEHVMLVDLGRNDLSRFCSPGTVKVTDSQVIERFSHVMHLVSTVTGSLRDDCTSVDALRYCFPAGTVSGAPKVRAMEIIDELESAKRGPYAGAVGYFDFSGNMDTCIVIRTMIATADRIFIQAGAGIVADSRPDREFDETMNKARALLDALTIAKEMTVVS